MFFGQSVNVARFDQQKHEIFEKLIEKQLSFFWRPEEVDVSRDRIDYQALPEHEKHIFISNLKYQTLLDSIQGRSPNVALLPLISIPELETWVETWSFSETIHSRSYTHIIRNIVNDPALVFDDIVTNEEIKKRAKDISGYYDDLIEMTSYYHLLGEGTHQVNGKTRHRQSARAEETAVPVPDERERAGSDPLLRQLRLLLRVRRARTDGRQRQNHQADRPRRSAAPDRHPAHAEPDAFRRRRSGNGGDRRGMPTAVLRSVRAGCPAGKEWAEYLFRDGSMIGLNKDILCQYVEYITNIRMQAVGLGLPFETRSNPIPWINAWLVSDNVQVAPQEVEVSSYLVGQIDSEINADDLSDFEL